MSDNDNWQDDEFEFPEDNLEKVLEYLKESSEMLKECPTEELCEKYKKLFPPQFGYFRISESRLVELNNLIINDTLHQLVKDGLIEMSWDDVKNDFVFFTKEDTYPPSSL
jgi:hypothetical protein